MITLSSSEFEYVDRRKEKKESPTPVAVEVPEPKPTANKSSWKNVGYMIVLIGSQNGPLVSGRAVGLRSDEKFFIADWFLPPIYPEHLDWTVEARKRLETFLGCDCTNIAPCAVHKLYFPQWIKADTQRLELIGNSPVPEAVEVMIKAERSRAASKIAVPR
jgi:hypothetical protein